MSTPGLSDSENTAWTSLTWELRKVIQMVATPEEIRLLCEQPIENTNERFELQQRITNEIRTLGNPLASSELLKFNLYQQQNSPFTGPLHTNILETMFDLAQELSETGDFAEAEDIWMKLLGAYKVLGIFDDVKVRYNLAATLNKDAGILGRADKYAEAEDLLKSVVPELRAGMGKNSQQAIGALRELSIAVGGQGRKEEAKMLNSQGLEELEENALISKEDKLVHKKSIDRVGAWLRDPTSVSWSLLVAQ